MFTLTTTLCIFVRDTRYLAGAFMLIFILCISCGRQLPQPQPGAAVSAEPRLPATEGERQLVKKIRDVAAVLNAIYEDPAVVAEVSAAIASGYYEDERVLLADLLYPEESALYRFMQQKQVESGMGRAVPRGTFSKRFREAAPEILSRRRAEVLLAAAGSRRQVLLHSGEEAPPLAGEELSIYHPYSEDFVPGERALAVPATAEADWVDVPDPTCGSTHEHDGTTCSKIRIDESYVQEHPVHIVGTGAEPSVQAQGQLLLSGRPRVSGIPTQQDSLPALIYLGKVRCTRQYDRLISFTGNGGGSELKFIRGEAYITLNNNQQVANTAFDIISVNLSRKDIRREREKHVYAIWDPNWEPERTQQVFGVYEEDTQGEREFSGSVNTEIKHPGGETSITPVEYSYKVQTQDNIIRQISWERASFFRYNRGGLAGCGQRNGYTWYDCHLPVAYSLPEL